MNCFPIEVMYKDNQEFSIVDSLEKIISGRPFRIVRINVQGAINGSNNPFRIQEKFQSR